MGCTVNTMKIICALWCSARDFGFDDRSNKCFYCALCLFESLLLHIFSINNGGFMARYEVHY